VLRRLDAVETERGRLNVEVVADSLQIPWAIAFLPDGRALVSERAGGRINLLDVRTGARTALEGVPPVYAETDGGMLDVAVHPDYVRNRWIYFAYSIRTDGGATTVVDRARVRGTRLVDRRRLFTALPAIDNANHFGSRLVLQDGYLFVTLGDRDQRHQAQQLDTHHGKIVRLHDDGRVPADNQFVGTAGALPEIWSLGHRNPQGLTLRDDGALWEHEHGPFGGDEINIVRRGANYGWPVITYGREYSGEIISAQPAREGLEQPYTSWSPSPGLSGMIFYTGDKFPWKGQLILGALAHTGIYRVGINEKGLAGREFMLTTLRQRIRDVRQGPDGFIYLVVDANPGGILRV
jgi:glucose/arabinose dehydrogenase